MQLEIPLYRSTDISTSRDAAAKVERFRCGHEAKIYDVLCQPIGITGMNYRELSYRAKLEPVATARRLAAMERRGLICRQRDMATGKYLQRDGCALWYRC